MNEQTMENLVQRMDQLGRENRRLRWFYAATVLVITAILVMGQAPSRSKIIEAEQFVLRDRSGTYRGGLGVWDDGSTGLSLTNISGKQRAFLKLLRDGSPMLVLKYKNARASLVLVPDGTPNLYLEHNNARILLTFPEGEPIITIMDGVKLLWSAP